MTLIFCVTLWVLRLITLTTIVMISLNHSLLWNSISSSLFSTIHLASDHNLFFSSLSIRYIFLQLFMWPMNLKNCFNRLNRFHRMAVIMLGSIGTINESLVAILKRSVVHLCHQLISIRFFYGARFRCNRFKLNFIALYFFCSFFAWLCARFCNLFFLLFKCPTRGNKAFGENHHCFCTHTHRHARQPYSRL